VSRTHKGFLKRLFELEVPEIHSGTVEIRAIAREAGSRSEGRRRSRQEGLDPGRRHRRPARRAVQAVVAELGGEKIDVIPWNDDPSAFVRNALSPAQVLSVDIDRAPHRERDRPERMLSLAIGREGQNARLAARLTGWRIDIRSDVSVAEAKAARPLPHRACSMRRGRATSPRPRRPATASSSPPSRSPRSSRQDDEAPGAGMRPTSAAAAAEPEARGRRQGGADTDAEPRQTQRPPSPGRATRPPTTHAAEAAPPHPTTSSGRSGARSSAQDPRQAATPRPPKRCRRSAASRRARADAASADPIVRRLPHQREKRELLRVVRTPDGTSHLDQTGRRQRPRCVRLSRDACITTAIARRAGRALETRSPPSSTSSSARPTRGCTDRGRMARVGAAPAAARPRKPHVATAPSPAAVQVADPRERGAVELPGDDHRSRSSPSLLPSNPAGRHPRAVKSGIFATINQLIDRDTGLARSPASSATR
jgi:transcription antitermination factor NusA-like protein/predicted RNA-binding protein YlxR (DUF448 family)